MDSILEPIFDYLRTASAVALGFIVGSLALVLATTVQIRSRKKKALKKLEAFEKKHGITGSSEKYGEMFEQMMKGFAAQEEDEE
jgi:hypothetical protein